MWPKVIRLLKQKQSGAMEESQHVMKVNPETNTGLFSADVLQGRKPFAVIPTESHRLSERKATGLIAQFDMFIPWLFLSGAPIDEGM